MKKENPVPVPDRGSSTDSAWWNHRCCGGNRTGVYYLGSFRCACGDQRYSNCSGSPVLYADRSNLRTDSVGESSQHEPDRRVTV